MRLVSPLLKKVVYPCLAHSGYLRRRRADGIAVVTYHGVLPSGYKVIDPVLDGSLVTADHFRRQLQLLRSRYHVISPAEFRLWCESRNDLPSGSVLLTCDDALQNSLSEMVPILQEAGLSCLFFVTGASLSEKPLMLWYEELHLMILLAGANFTVELPEVGVQGVQGQISSGHEKHLLWVNLTERLSRYSSAERHDVLEQIRTQLGLSPRWKSNFLDEGERRRRFLVLSPAELKLLSAADMCIGAHTMSHPMLTEMSPDCAWDEIAGSRSELEHFLGKEVWALAYPFGDTSSVSKREVGMAERAGFKCSFLNIDGGFAPTTSRFAWPRVHVTAEMSLAEFEAHVSGFYRSLRKHLLGETQDASLMLRA
jgi:peptidoglycan/xylan/chitin deacetylase (PgdA/CDA1 family)